MVKRAKKAPPVVRAQSAGRVTQTLEHLADLYRKRNPDREVRYVYNPEHKPELSNVLSRRAQGFRPVMGEELGDEIPGFPQDKEVRVADLVMMSIEVEAAEELRADNEERANDLRDSTSRKFYEAMQEIEVQGSSGTHRSKPIGRSIIEERDFEFDIEQREGE